MSYDQLLFNTIHAFSGMSSAMDAIIYFFAVYAPILMVALAIVYVIASKYSMKEKMLWILTAAGTSLIARYVVTGLIRLMIHRARPFLLANAHSLFVSSGSSFPSAHATVLFTMGTFLHSFNRRAGTIFFGFSSIVCLARVAAGVHYPLDIIVGALVGIATASVVIVYGLPILRYDIPRVIRQNT